MRIKLGVAASAARLGGEPSGRAKRLHQPDDERNRHAEKRGSGMTRPATLDKAGNPLTQIERIGFRHRESPPGGSESHASPQRNPHRVKLRIRRSRAPDTQLNPYPAAAMSH